LNLKFSSLITMTTKQLVMVHIWWQIFFWQSTWWQIKTKNMLTHAQFELVCATDNPYGVYFIIGIDLNDLGRSLLLLCVLFMRRIHAPLILWSLDKFFGLLFIVCLHICRVVNRPDHVRLWKVWVWPINFF
jgi:hypothetical protein